VQLYPSELKALDIVITPKPFPGINPDNAPFFVIIAAVAKGITTYFDWMYNGRNKQLLKLTDLGVMIKPIDNEHKLQIIGSSKLTPKIVKSPDALRPSAVLLALMMSIDGVSYLVDTYHLRRGYQDLPERLNACGANMSWGEDHKPQITKVK
jgi:UDP-N-acetylglucosamine 1-carboxyvinyltransferase